MSAAYYTIPELAELWKCSPNLIYTYLRTGKLAGFKLGVSWRVSDEARLECEARLTASAQPVVFRPTGKIH